MNAKKSELTEQQINDIEDNMNSRTPNALGLHCRWIHVSINNEESNNHVHCGYGQDHPSLFECMKCYGLIKKY